MNNYKETLLRIAEPMDEQIRKMMQRRKSQRHLIAMSTSIAARIERALRIKGMKRTELAQLMGVSPANITRYLSGKCNFELKTLLTLEEVLGIALINREENPLMKSNSGEYPFLQHESPISVVSEYQEACYSISGGAGCEVV